MLRPVIAEDLDQALRNGSWQLNFMNAEVRTLKPSDGVLGEHQDIKAPVVAEERQQRFEVKMVAGGDLLFKPGRQAIGGKHTRAAETPHSSARLWPARVSCY